MKATGKAVPELWAPNRPILAGCITSNDAYSIYRPGGVGTSGGTPRPLSVDGAEARPAKEARSPVVEETEGLAEPALDADPAPDRAEQVAEVAVFRKQREEPVGFSAARWRSVDSSEPDI